jgi:hypothetical protein
LDPSIEPDLPKPLPKPLSDPLRRYRWIVFLPVVSMIGMGVDLLLPNVGKVREAAARTEFDNNLRQIGVATGQNDAHFDGQPRTDDESAHDSGRGPHIILRTLTLRDAAGFASLTAAFTLFLCVFLMLPRRATNAIYLRSFRNDATTGALRNAAQAALGRTFRLSGIRDPRRRWPALIRHLLFILFLIRYAQPKFMNLEAGHDWKARLWRSLGEARCALIDVSQLTPFVREEIELAIRCLGLHRVLFIGDDSRTADEWRQAVLTALGSPDVQPEGIQLAIWADSAAGRAAFRDRMRAFADRLPADAPGPNAAAFPGSASSADLGGDAVTDENWRAFFLANLIGMGVVGVLSWAGMLTADARLFLFLPGVIYDTLAFLLLGQYFAECGSLRQRLRIGAPFLFGAVFASLPVFYAVVAPPMERSRNNLKNISLATVKRANTNNSKPPPSLGLYPTYAAAGVGAPGNGDGGLFFFLLPYIEQDNLYKPAYFATWDNNDNRHGPNPTGTQWDSWTQNSSVKTYLCPADWAEQDSRPARSSYVTNGQFFLQTSWDNGFSQYPASIPDGTSNTVLVGERTLWGEGTPPARRSQPHIPSWEWLGTTEVAPFDRCSDY